MLGSRRHARIAAASLALTALSLTGACTLVLDVDRHQSDVVPVAASDFCANLADIACVAVRDCCNQPGLDLDACVRNSAADCANRLGNFAVDPRTGYDPAEAGLALAEARGLAADCDPALSTWLEAPTGMQRVLAGTIPYDGSCEPNGLTDTAALVACADDGVCSREGSLANPTWTCIPPVLEGNECSYDAACLPGLRCTATVQFFTTGTCEALLANGDPCSRNSECETFLCDVTCRSATVDEAYCGG